MSRSLAALARRIFGQKAQQPVETPKARSVADLLEFGYSVSGADRRFPHMPA